MAKQNEPQTVAERTGQQAQVGQPPTAAEQQARIAELEAKLAGKEDGRKTTRGLTPSIQALATIDTALRKLKGEDAAAVQRVVAWIAQEWLPANKVMTDKPGG